MHDFAPEQERYLMNYWAFAYKTGPKSRALCLLHTSNIDASTSIHDFDKLVISVLPRNCQPFVMRVP